MDAGAPTYRLTLCNEKNRPGSLLRVIARPEDQERLVQIVFSETSTLDCEFIALSAVEERRMVEVETPWGKVRGKVSGHASGPGSGEMFAPEYDDCRALAERHGAPLKQALAAALEAI